MDKFINVIKFNYYSRSKNLIEYILLWVPETCGVASTKYQIQAWNSLYKDKQHANFIGYYRFSWSYIRNVSCFTDELLCVKRAQSTEEK